MRGIQLPLDAVRLTGKGASEYLQGQVTADIGSLMEREDAVDAFILEPSGKVNSLVTVVRRDDDFVLLVDEGYSESLLARLKRFAIRAKTEFVLEGSAHVVIRDHESMGDFSPVTYTSTNLIPAPFVLRLGEKSEVDHEELETRLDINGLGLLRAERVAPLMRDLSDTSAFPATFPDIFTASVSLSKGCYTGQELVARMDSRGSTAPLVFSTLAPLDDTNSFDATLHSETLTVDDVEAGKVTTFYLDDHSKLMLATGYVKRSYADKLSVEFIGASSNVRFIRTKPS